MHRYMTEEHHPVDWIPPEVPVTLNLLKEAGFHLGVLSNRDEPCSAYLEQVDLLKYFELNLVAGEVNAWKPDPQIFHHALQRLHQTPRQTIYVGDNYYADILGAQKAGIQPVLIDPDGLFPEADCPIIQSLPELLTALEHGS
jgi:putative hydrolase of the HAD superfamily